jgi:NAD+ synthase
MKEHQTASALELLDLDLEKEKQRICSFLKHSVSSLGRNGVVIGLSGGIDSAVTASLCVSALGPERVFGLILPDKESSVESSRLAAIMARRLGIQTVTNDITPVLEGFGTYEKRDRVVSELFPDLQEDGFKFKLTLPGGLLERDTLNFFTIQVTSSDGKQRSARLKKEHLNAIVAASNTKQRTRMLHLYYHAEREHYCVCGTTNRSEFLEGFFVRHGDGGVDLEPIVHLYKMQVYMMAEHLGVIEEIRRRIPTPDTYSAPITDEEFYFRLPFEKLDPLLFQWEHGRSVEETASRCGLTDDQVRRAFRDFGQKYKVACFNKALPAALEHPGPRAAF